MSLEIEVAECFLVHLLLLCFRWRFILRWRTTRHKNPQHVAQHCFVARFCWLLPFFTLSDQLVAQQKHLLQVEESCCEKKSTGLLWATNFGFVARFFFQTHNLSCNKFACALQINQSARHISSTRNKLMKQGGKRETSTQNLQRNNVARQVGGFCISYFATFKDETTTTTTWYL